VRYADRHREEPPEAKIHADRHRDIPEAERNTDSQRNDQKETYIDRQKSMQDREE
jgi:hypothetical protein